MNKALKWTIGALAGFLVLGLVTWSWAGPMPAGSIYNYAPATEQSYAQQGNSAGYPGGMMRQGGMGMMGRGPSVPLGQFSAWCVQAWGRMGRGMGNMWSWMRGQGGIARAPLPATNPAPESNSRQSATTVQIRDFAFVPAKLYVQVGEKITWINRDGVGHNVVLQGGQLVGPLLSQGQSWSHTFTQAGIYDYYCGPHPFMKGQIIVR